MVHVPTMPTAKTEKNLSLFIVFDLITIKGQGQSRGEKHVQPQKEAHTRWLKHKDPKNKVLKE